MFRLLSKIFERTDWLVVVSVVVVLGILLANMLALSTLWQLEVATCLGERNVDGVIMRPRSPKVAETKKEEQEKAVPFRTVLECPKCMGLRAGAPFNYAYSHKRDIILVTCGKCGYRWYELPHDKTCRNDGCFCKSQPKKTKDK